MYVQMSANLLPVKSLNSYSHRQVDPRAHENRAGGQWVSLVAKVHHCSKTQSTTGAVSGEDLQSCTLSEIALERVAQYQALTMFSGGILRSTMRRM